MTEATTKTTSTSTTILVSVSNIYERDKLIKRIYTNLTTEPDTRFTVQQDQINRIKVFHNAKPGICILIRTYLILVIPVNIDLSILDSVSGTVDFHLEETINDLVLLTKKLQALQGKRFVRVSNNVKNFEKQLAGCLC